MSGGFPFKIAAWLLALALTALPIVGVLNGWFAADRWPLRQLRIDAEFHHVSAEQVRAAVTPGIGVGFFAVDLDAIRASVEELPWVERAEVRKRWPDQLDVTIVERRAAASWSPQRLVSESGELFSVPGDALPEGLPQLGGPDDRVAEVLAFQRELAAAFAGTGQALRGVRLSPRGSWYVDLDGGAEIVVGREQPHERIARFLESLARIEAAPYTTLARADLRYANGFAIEWRAVEPPPPPPAPAAPDPETEPAAAPDPGPETPQTASIATTHTNATGT